MRKIKFFKGQIYHLYNRGVDKRDIFLDDNDRWRFLQGLFLFNNIKSATNILWQTERLHGKATFKTIKDFLITDGDRRIPIVKIMADCLMPNHFHLLVEEIQNNGISKFMHKLGVGYTEYFNKKYKRSGSLFQGTFKAVRVSDQKYLEQLLIYINVINPAQLIEPELKEKGIKNITKAINFINKQLWSTHQEYRGNRESIIIDKGILGEIFADPKKYQKIIERSLLAKKLKKLNKISNLLLEN